MLRRLHSTHPCRRRTHGFRLHRNLLQPPPSSQQSRSTLAARLRETNVRPKQNQLTSTTYQQSKPLFQGKIKRSPHSVPFYCPLPAGPPFGLTSTNMAFIPTNQLTTYIHWTARPSRVGSCFQPTGSPRLCNRWNVFDSDASGLTSSFGAGAFTSTCASATSAVRTAESFDRVRTTISAEAGTPLRSRPRARCADQPGKLRTTFPPSSPECYGVKTRSLSWKESVCDNFPAADFSLYRVKMVEARGVEPLFCQ